MTKLKKKQGVPKGADPATYERCVQHVKGKVRNPYAVCAAGGAGRSGKKGKKMKKALIDEINTIAEKTLAKAIGPKQDAENIEKALQAGYDAPEPAPDQIQDVETHAGSQGTLEQKAAEAEAQEATSETKPVDEVKAESDSVPEQTEATQEKPEPKFAGNLFKEYSLGATLKQGPTGNVMSNMKPSQVDYVQQAKDAIKNEVVSPDEFNKED